jgi:hypothetical protein
VKEVEPQSPHGVYRYVKESGLWELIHEGSDAFIPKEKYAVIYFDNTRCPACRKYDLHWYPFVKACVSQSRYAEYGFYIVLCGWFSNECDSLTASSTFTHFNIHASPTTIFLGVEGGRIIHQERYEGVMTEVELTLIIKEFSDRVSRVKKGLPVEKPLQQEGTLVELLKKLLGGATH